MVIPSDLKKIIEGLPEWKQTAAFKILELDNKILEEISKELDKENPGEELQVLLDAWQFYVETMNTVYNMNMLSSGLAMRDINEKDSVIRDSEQSEVPERETNS